MYTLTVVLTTVAFLYAPYGNGVSTLNVVTKTFVEKFSTESGCQSSGRSAKDALIGKIIGGARVISIEFSCKQSNIKSEDVNNHG